LKSDYRAKTSEIPSIFPVIWEFDLDETGSMRAASTTTQFDANRLFLVSAK
jgi:hypothetical protein